ncbi:NADH:flavin oxidoreductase [Sphingobium sp. Sx8-8]|uniref:NADH:flavin oxidoreductase n=1 Tax=Sphingobium sp. Sx8-8 TaxID=2933617 RepID=UPI001F5886BD|nr:NADH:flavin oxidoreductase [Sphingobium sp. Sx8-8]
MTMPSPDLSPLFQPLTVRGLTLANRIVMSPMTREFAEDGVLTDPVDDYYGRRAAGGTGLIVTEGTSIDHIVSHYSRKVPNFYGEAALARWRQVAERVHAEGGRIFPQLWHTGVARRRKSTHNPDIASQSPSGIGMERLGPDSADPNAVAKPSRVPPVAMEIADIEAVIQAYGEAAAQAKAAGFDGAAVHGAHGYLPDQFLWERSNRRTDRYGGSLENRLRFSLELVGEMRRRVGPDYPIMFRFSQWKGWDYRAKLAQTPSELERLLVPLADAGVDIFDASTRRFWLPEFEGSPLNLAGWAKKITGKTVMTVGSVGLESPLGDLGAGSRISVSVENLSRLMEMFARGDFDLVGVGRALLANPDWARLVREGRFGDLKPYNADAMEGSLEAAF